MGATALNQHGQRWWNPCDISPDAALANKRRHWLINEQVRFAQAVADRPRDQTKKLVIWMHALAAIQAHESGQVDLVSMGPSIRAPEAQKNPARAMRRRQYARIR